MKNHRQMVICFLALILATLLILPMSLSAAETGNNAQDSTVWPEIDGLAYQEGQYLYVAGNPYGGEAGELAGIIKGNVYVEGEKIGGVCFKAEVCKVMLENALAETPEGEPKLTSIVPLDILDHEGELTISDVYVTGADNNDYPMIMITCDSEVDLVNTNLGSQKFNYGYAKLKEGNRSFVFDVFCSKFLRDGEFDNSQAYKYRRIILTGDELNKGDEFKCGFGEKILTKNKNTKIFLTSISSDKTNKLEINNFLAVAGKIIFPIVKEKEIESEVDLSKYKTISAGYTGPEVVALKQRMYELGYFKTNTVNENFTESTKKYVEEFEKANGLPVDGIADPEMQALFYSNRAKPKP